MATIDIEIDDYIDEVSDYCLVRELQRRSKLSKKASDFFDELKELVNEDASNWPEIKTLDDEMKRQWVLFNWDNIKP